MTKKELLQKLKALGNISEEAKKGIVCNLIGHSNIITMCFGYVSCARCEAQIGDTLGGVYSNDKAVIVGHNCDTCKTNYEALTWKDKFMTVNPFEDATI